MFQRSGAAFSSDDAGLRVQDPEATEGDGGNGLHGDEMKRLADPDVLAFAAQRINALKAQRSSQPWSMVPSISTRNKARFGL